MPGITIYQLFSFSPDLFETLPGPVQVTTVDHTKLVPLLAASQHCSYGRHHLRVPAQDTITAYTLVILRAERPSCRLPPV